MITLQNHAPAPKVAVAAAAAASTGAPHASIGALPDGADFAALLGDQITLSAAATTTPAAATSAEDRRDQALRDGVAGLVVSVHAAVQSLAA